MHRSTTVVGILLALLATPVAAQGIVGGFATERASGQALPCVRVTLLDATGTAVDSTWTRERGAFEFSAPIAGTYRFRFTAWGLTDVLTAPEQLGRHSDFERVFQLQLYLDSAALATDDGEAPPASIRARFGRDLAVHYPDDLRRAGIEGDVVLAFAVDTAGRVDQENVLALHVTDAAFARSVRWALGRAHYPSWVGLPDQSCVLVIQRFRFRLH